MSLIVTTVRDVSIYWVRSTAGARRAWLWERLSAGGALNAYPEDMAGFQARAGIRATVAHGS